jgi:DNA gyrase/topoisomerase IV subunit B
MEENKTDLIVRVKLLEEQLEIQTSLILENTERIEAQDKIIQELLTELVSTSKEEKELIVKICKQVDFNGDLIEKMRIWANSIMKFIEQETKYPELYNYEVY